MEEVLQKKLRAIEPGERQQFRNISVFPLFSEAKPPARHLVLREAMDQGLITVYRGGLVRLAMFPGNGRKQPEDCGMQGYQRRANHRRRPLH